MAINDAVCANRLTWQMKEKRLSQCELARRIGTYQVNISKIAKGRGSTIVKRYQQIADALDISSGYLVGEYDDPQGPKMTGKRLCKTCQREIYANKFECAECLKNRLTEQREANKPAVKTDHGLAGTMTTASMIAREARKRGMSYGQYAAIYDHKEVKI